MCCIQTLYFHGSTAVAPLKPGWPALSPPIGDTFPRLNSRGPIEAARWHVALGTRETSFCGQLAAVALKENSDGLPHLLVLPLVLSFRPEVSALVSYCSPLSVTICRSLHRKAG